MEHLQLSLCDVAEIGKARHGLSGKQVMGDLAFERLDHDRGKSITNNVKRQTINYVQDMISVKSLDTRILGR